ncbi:MAG: helix-turn-helix domain-containing protein [Myxococcota bacterium]
MARPRQISDEEILAAARAVFVEHGPAASTSTIAEQLGVTQPALFRRFGSKEDLMLAALTPPQHPEWVRHVESGPDDRPLRDQLLDLAGRATQFLSEIIPCVTVLRSSGVDPQTLMQRYQKGPPPMLALQALTGWFERARDTGLVDSDFSPRVAANLFLGAMHLPAYLSHLASHSDRPVPVVFPPLAETVELIARGMENRR